MSEQARAAGEDIIDFGMGNPDQPTPQHIVDKLTEAAQVIYQQAAAEAQASQEAGGEGGESPDDVVDAEFEEVKDDKK